MLMAIRTYTKAPRPALRKPVPSIKEMASKSVEARLRVARMKKDPR